MDSAEKYSFSQSRVYRFIVKNGGSLYLIAILVIFVAAVIGFKKTFQFYRLLYVLAALSTAVLLVGYYLRRIACGVLIDFSAKKIIFDMCRGSSIQLCFDEILSIEIRRDIVFVLKDKKIIYNGIKSKNLMDALDRIRRAIERP